MPIMQWLYFDALECLPEDKDVVLTEEECAPVSEQARKHITPSDMHHKCFLVNPRR